MELGNQTNKSKIWVAGEYIKIKSDFLESCLLGGVWHDQ